MKKSLLLIIFAVLLITAFSVTYCSKYKDRAELSAIKPDFEVYRFDKATFSLDTARLLDQASELRDKFPQFFDLYTQGILRIGDMSQASFQHDFTLFLVDPVQQDAYQEAEKVFGDFQSQKDGIYRAFQKYSYYFPEKQLPDIYTFIGYYNQSMVVDSGVLGIALEKYLYPDFVRYIELGIPSFIRQKMDAGFIVPDCMRALAQTEFPYNDSIDNLSNNIIWEGMILFFVEQMVPDLPEASIIQYTESQMAYCHDFEGEMWKYLVDNKYLFETDYKIIRRYVSDGPFTPGFTNSPSRTGTYIGWQIVRKYMKEHSDISLKQLMQIRDYQKILNGSSYNPL